MRFSFQAWAVTLLNTNKLVPQSASPYGENIYSMQCSDPNIIVSAREVVSKWYSEKKDHKFGTEPKVLNTCKLLLNSSHYFTFYEEYGETNMICVVFRSLYADSMEKYN